MRTIAYNNSASSPNTSDRIIQFVVDDGAAHSNTSQVATTTLSFNLVNVINGTQSNDTLIGTAGTDSISGFGGDDFLDGKGGNDTLDGGTGNFDQMFGGDGNDTIIDPDGVLGAHGGTGNDIISVNFAPGWDNDNNSKTSPRSDGKITGGFGDDNITVTMDNPSFFINMKGDEPTSNQPQDGNDVITLLGSYANSVVDMGGGNDTFNGGSGSDNVSGQNGDDLLNGNNGNDGLNGGSGNDTLLGGAGNDNLTGGNGDDLLTGGLGSDTLNGGAGSDRIIYNTLAERGDTINEFSTASDIIDLMRLMPTLTGYSGNVDGYLRFTQSGANALLQIDSDGGGNSFVNLATLTNVSASDLGVGTNVIV
ncbi:MAG: type I secretion C-terminal target domain-containing protein [Hydrococcus sp. Prado102]|nr:type I secretion C-terminal target domain-containing protein [Hydrococcus sp. Prado102]